MNIQRKLPERRHGGFVITMMLAFASITVTAGKVPAGFTEHFAKVNGTQLHYFIGGKGSPVVLLHGYAQTSHMWNPIMPLLATNHTVIVPDLRGAGGSSKPESGYDKKNMAVDVHELVTSLGFKRASIVGHDIGLMVGYAYAGAGVDGRKSQRQFSHRASSARGNECPGSGRQRFRALADR
jgi:hypothetical protein